MSSKLDAFSYIGQTHLFSRTLDMILISFSNSDDELDPSGRMWLRDSPTDMDGQPRIEVTQAGKPSLDESHTSYVWTTGGLLPPPRTPGLRNPRLPPLHAHRACADVGRVAELRIMFDPR